MGDEENSDIKTKQNKTNQKNQNTVARIQKETETKFSQQIGSIKKKKCYKAHKDGKRQKVKSRTEVNTHGNYFQNPKARKDPQIL